MGEAEACGYVMKEPAIYNYIVEEIKLEMAIHKTAFGVDWINYEECIFFQLALSILKSLVTNVTLWIVK